MKITNRDKHFLSCLLGVIITFAFTLFYGYGMKRDFNLQIQDFVEGRGCWRYDVKDTLPPNFRFEYFSPDHQSIDQLRLQPERPTRNDNKYIKI